MQKSNLLSLSAPAAYRITVQGRVDDSWHDCFDHLSLTTAVLPNGVTVTVLSVEVADQAALHGLLMHVRDLGLPLLAVSYAGWTTNEPSIFETNLDPKENQL